MHIRELFSLQLKSGPLVQNTPEGQENDLTDPNFTAQKAHPPRFARAHTDNVHRWMGTFVKHTINYSLLNKFLW